MSGDGDKSLLKLMIPLSLALTFAILPALISGKTQSILPGIAIAVVALAIIGLIALLIRWLK
jgi:hypothetical protein